jgi:chemotaxis protein MotA
MNLLKTQFELFNVATRDGLINIESHISDPEKSSIFSKNPFLLKNHHALNYLCDTMKLLLGGGIPPYEIESMLETDIDTHHAEHASSPSLVQKLGDSLPGLGIVAPGDRRKGGCRSGRDVSRRAPVVRVHPADCHAPGTAE